MPTRLNKTSIGISDSIKNQLEQYDKESWDELMLRVLVLMEREAEEE